MKKQLTLLILIILFPIVSCNNSGGVYLGESENYGKSYRFGTQEEIDMLQKLAKAYSDKNPEELFKYYSDEYMTEKRKENYKKWN